MDTWCIVEASTALAMRKCRVQSLVEAGNNDDNRMHRYQPPQNKGREVQQVFQWMHGDATPGSDIDIAMMQLMHTVIHRFPMQESMNQVEPLHGLTHILCIGKTGSDWLGRSRHAGVGRIDVHFPGVNQITNHYRTLEHVNVRLVIGQSCRVIQIPQGRLTNLPDLGINHVYCRT